jgi:hypothetical protein
MKNLETLLEGIFRGPPQVVPEIQNKTIDALIKKGYDFANWIKPASMADQEDGKLAAVLHKRTTKFSHSFAEVEPDGSINGEPPEVFLTREDKASAPVAMDEYALAMGIKPKREMTTANIPEDTAEPMDGVSEECWVRGRKVNIDSIELDEGEGDSAKAIKAHYVDGTPLTDEELDELNNPGKSTGVPNVKQQPDLVQGAPRTVIGEEDKKEISAAAIEKGTKHEMEHTKDPLVAKKIAMDHLKEDPHYYEKLAKVGLEERMHGLTDSQKQSIVNKIEKEYEHLHVVDWNEICQMLLDRSVDDSKVVMFPGRTPST